MPDDPIRILFLDIDGVLRRREAPLYALEPDLCARFERVVRALPGVQIVVTSSWREAFSLDEIRENYSPGAPVILTDCSVGFDDVTAAEMIRRLA